MELYFYFFRRKTFFCFTLYRGQEATYIEWTIYNNNIVSENKSKAHVKQWKHMMDAHLTQNAYLLVMYISMLSSVNTACVYRAFEELPSSAGQLLEVFNPFSTIIIITIQLVIFSFQNQFFVPLFVSIKM